MTKYLDKKFQVALSSEAYAKGWDVIFTKREPGEIEEDIPPRVIPLDAGELVLLTDGWKKGFMAEVVGPANVLGCVEVKLFDGEGTPQVVEFAWCRAMGKRE